MADLTLTQFRQIVPYAGPKAGDWLPALNDAMHEFGVDTPLRVCAFIAQLAHESGSFHYVRELASGHAYDHRADLGNTDPEAIRIAAANNTTPGPFYRGGGPLQLTGYDNYLRCGAALGVDLVNHPELIEQPITGCRAAGWFWYGNDVNYYADQDDIDGVSDLINRGRKTAIIGDSNGYAERLAFYRRAKHVLGI